LSYEEQILVSQRVSEGRGLRAARCRAGAEAEVEAVRRLEIAEVEAAVLSKDAGMTR
jgi:hypothetical protein